MERGETPEQGYDKVGGVMSVVELMRQAAAKTPPVSALFIGAVVLELLGLGFQYIWRL